jgi:hypothetical protein
MIWLTLLDWSEQIANEVLLDLIRKTFPEVWDSLDVGSVTRSGKKTKYKSSIEKQALPLNVWERIEWYGGALIKMDPEHKWQSYLSITSDRTRELVICSSIESLLPERLLSFFEEASKLGNLGYGFGDDFDRPGITYYISGITFGLPKDEMERQEAKRLGRWFSERLSMGGLTPKKRYLHGMYRGAYQINLLNRSHVTIGSTGRISLSGISHNHGTLVSRENDNYIWSIPRNELAFAEAELAKADLIV